MPIIPIVDAKQMFDTYASERVPLINTHERAKAGANPDFEATRYGEWDYNEFKAYMDYLNQIDTAIKANNTLSVGIKGIRFYFGTYTDNATQASGKSVPVKNGDSFSKHNSFFLIPTIQNGIESVPFSLNQGTKTPVLHQNDFRNVDKNNLDSLAMNEANLVPPPYPDPDN